MSLWQCLIVVSMRVLLASATIVQASVVNFQIEERPSAFPIQFSTLGASPTLSALRSAGMIDKLKARVDAGGYMAEHAS